MRKRILLAPDKFKGSLSAEEICLILTEAIASEMPDILIEQSPLADGGDGSLEILAAYLNLTKQICKTVDPIGKSIETTYFTSDKTAYIELASASGLVLLADSDRNPMLTSTYGTGLQMVDAIKNGMEHIFLFLGGSATNDGGMGIGNALGYSFFDKRGNELKPKGESLQFVDKIVPTKEAKKINKLTLCCDVTNLPFGPKGAALVYAKQKGANAIEIEILDKGLANLCHQIQRYNGMNLSGLKGGGAAGGVALTLSAFFGAEIISGMTLFSEISNLDQKIRDADLVISGEGKLDSQSLEGKVVSGVAEICEKYSKDLWLMVGKNELSASETQELGVEKIFCIMDVAEDESDAMKNAKKYMKETGIRMVKHFT